MSGWGSQSFGADSFGGNIQISPEVALTIRALLYMDQDEGNPVEQDPTDSLVLGQIVSTSGFCVIYTAEEDLINGDIVYESSAGFVSKASNTDLNKSRVIGVVLVDASLGQPVAVVHRGPAPITGSSFTVNTPIFLGSDGRPVSILPYTTGVRVIRIGHAHSPTVISVKLQDLGRRAS